MRGIQLKELVKEPDDLIISDIPDPVPAEDEYIVAIHATATNFFDLLQIAGKYQHQPKLPWIAGTEFAGMIEKIPSSGKSPKYRVGDKVFGARQGGYATKIAALEDQLRPMPKDWSFTDAAGLYVTVPTSYAGLVQRAGVKQGDWVLVHAAAGGVGLAAVQIAKAFGATVIATAGTQQKLDVARSFGADYVVNYRDKDWPDRVKKLTPKGRGVDIVYDPVGMVGPSMKCIAWNGRLLVIGFAGGELEKIATNRVLLKNVSVVGLHWGMYWQKEPETVPKVWEGIYQLIERGKYKGTTFTDREFSGLESVPEALKALGARNTWGKVVVKVPQPQNNKL
ncbi:NAD(P)-binding protein [Patellaria atrata CBS 101060]|uniref:NAD(P)-binding protein n=1 Tax=Patellaria atrata CBS 101060 TaxID=1346257 RepID=A0A9P4SCS7_9PEZI|nr:NAD(P)-binding protein [Patellaria atrata CBS 101060]